MEQIQDKENAEAADGGAAGIQLKNQHLMVSLRLNSGVCFHFLRLANAIPVPTNKAHEPQAISESFSFSSASMSSQASG